MLNPLGESQIRCIGIWLNNDSVFELSSATHSVGIGGKKNLSFFSDFAVFWTYLQPYYESIPSVYGSVTRQPTTWPTGKIYSWTAYGFVCGLDIRFWRFFFAKPFFRHRVGQMTTMSWLFVCYRNIDLIWGDWHAFEWSLRSLNYDTY